MTTTSNDVRSILAAAAIASGDASRQAQRVNDKRTSAYTLYILAGITAETVEVLDTASNELFEEIRTTGKVVGADGKSHGINAKPNKDGTGFLIPSAISAAKSYVADAMRMGVDLGTADEPLSFTEARKAVQIAKEAERRAKATGDEAIRIAVGDMLAKLSESASTAKGAKLGDLYRALSGLFESEEGADEADDADTLAQAA